MAALPVTPLRAIVLKDLQLFFTDRRAVIMSFAVPIAIASFFGSIFSGPGPSNQPARIGIAIVDQDATTISRGIVAGAQGDTNLRVATPGADEARDAVRRGRTSVAVVIPNGFGEAAGSAFLGDGAKPSLQFLYDPSRTSELAMVRGVMTEYVMEAVSREMFGGAQGRAEIEKVLPRIDASPSLPPEQKRLLMQMLSAVQAFYSQQPDGSAAAPRGITMPYQVEEDAVTSGENVAYNGYAHSFAGMGIQFLLFATANLGIEILLERQRGLWRRLRSAPISRFTLLGGKTASMTLIALMTLLVSFGFAMGVFHVRIAGSLLGFAGVAVACSIMAATFGLLIAALGRTPAATRGVTTLAVLMMVMLGGAWVPTFIFPTWLQRATVVVPARWAVDGLDAMTWRGLGVGAAVTPTLVLLGFAVVFGAIALARFRWEEG
jgi:ABC-2 type transport system permease protein